MMWCIKTVHRHECGSLYEQFWGPFQNVNRAIIYGRSMKIDFGDRLISWRVERLIVPYINSVQSVQWRT